MGPHSPAPRLSLQQGHSRSAEQPGWAPHLFLPMLLIVPNADVSQTPCQLVRRECERVVVFTDTKVTARGKSIRLNS